MSELILIPVLHLGHPPTAPERRLEQYTQRVIAPLVAALVGTEGLRVSVHITGWLLKWLARKQPALLRELTRPVADGRVEILGGAWTDAFLSGLPDPDIAGQLQLQGKLVERWIRRRPRGVWLAERAWDPALIRPLVRGGFTHSFVDEGAFEAAGVEGAGGTYVTESGGLQLRLFPALSDPAAPLAEADPAGALAERLRARAGVSALCWALPLDRMLAPREVEGLAAALASLGRGGPLAETATSSEAAERLASSGRVYLPPWLPGGAGGWEASLVRYTEVNHLHKRMLLTSAEVGRLRAAVRAGESSRRDLLELATESLYRGQAAGCYTHGDRAGFYDASLRHLAAAALIRGEAAAREGLGEHKRLGRLRADYDCDGEEEVLIRTGDLCATLSPARGGALLALDLWGLPGNVLNTMSRRPERYHGALEPWSDLPALVVDGVAQLPEADPGPDPGPERRDMARRLHGDRAPRASFVDRFLDESLSLSSAQRGQLPELGDFAGGRYRLLAVEPHEILDACVVQMTREGHVLRGRQTCLVQVAKRFIFHRDMPVIDARYEITNRYHTPLETAFAIELNLGLDARFARAAQLSGGGGSASAGDPGVLTGVRQLGVRDPRGRFRLVLETSAAAWVYHFPVECMVRVGAGIKPAPQGVCLMLIWPLQLWGHERAAFDLSLNIELDQ